MHPNDAPSLIPSWLFRDQLVTKADLDAFKQDLLLSLAWLMQENATKPPKKWLKSHEVMALLHISHGTLYSMRSSGALPFKKIGNIIYYDQDEISDALLPGRSIASVVGRPFKKSQVYKITAVKKSSSGRLPTVWSYLIGVHTPSVFKGKFESWDRPRIFVNRFGEWQPRTKVNLKFEKSKFEC